jgi:hypothetical protein
MILISSAVALLLSENPPVIAEINPVVFETNTGLWRPLKPAKDLLNNEGHLAVVLRLEDAYYPRRKIKVEVKTVTEEGKKPRGKPRIVPVRAIFGTAEERTGKNFQFIPIEEGALCAHLEVTVSIVGVNGTAKSVDVPFECGD